MPDERSVQESGLPPDLEGTVVTIGTFDGLHGGHQDVLRRLAARAAAVRLPALVVTFDPHPREVVSPSRAPLLLTPGEEKSELLAETGVGYAAVLPFTPRLASYTAEQFVALLRRRFRMRELLIGYDSGFGRGREGTVDVLQELGARDRFRVEVVPPVLGPGGRPISSTSIREAIRAGDLERAASALGRSYAVGGRVRRGAQRGRLLGFPTLNVELPTPRKLLPPPGVYAVRAQTPSGAFGGMMNLGPRPTFGDDAFGLEVHLFDAAGDWYGAHVRVDFVARLRDTRKFDGPDALVAQLRRDEEAARRALDGARMALERT